MEIKAVSYTRDKEGKVENYHLNDVANTVHSSTGGGGNTDCYVEEPRVMQVGNIYEDTDNFKNRTMGRVYSDRGLSPTINCCGGGDREPKIVEPQVLTPKRTEFGKAVRSQYENGELDISRHDMTAMQPREDSISNTITTVQKDNILLTPYRIRKLTPRECFRLMDVDESDIDKLLDAGISNSQLYKLAGNSICVGVLYHIFRKLFVEVENENQQLTLF